MKLVRILDRTNTESNKASKIFSNTRIRIRRSVLAGSALLLFLSVGTFSIGTAFAYTPPPPPPAKTQLTIDGLYGATKLAVDNLQKTPAGLQVLATALIIGGAKAAFSQLNDPSSPGTVVGGLDLDAYCASIGNVNSYTPVPGEETTGGAYSWDCVSSANTQTPIDMQAACNYQYPDQLTIAYAQDPNNSYSWVCIDPISGAFTDQTTGTTVDSITAGNSAATLVSSQGSDYLAIEDQISAAQTNTATDILTIEGDTMAYNNKILSNNSAAAAAAANTAIQNINKFNGGL